ncbi:MAG TPA: anthranilate synthase component I [Verrucomicrobiota bacterium]|nr:anthranilate synthase component I [Verrucomicrobiota bacterium]HNU49880.1 anthranilate synthase component I [Verrucomicrobiota bacterium]
MYTPSREEFLRLAQQGNLIPVSRRILADYETPLSAYRKLREQGESFLFESVEGGERLGRYSFVGCAPRMVIRQSGRTVEVLENGRLTQMWTVVGAGVPAGPGQVQDGLAVVEQVLGRYHAVPVPGLPRFTGGAVGYLGYEFIHDIEPVVPRPAEDALGAPVLYFLVADQLLVFDRVAQTLTVMVNAVVEPGSDPGGVYAAAVCGIERLIAKLAQPCPQVPVTLPDDPPALPFVSNLTRERFLENVRKAMEYIRAGDIIQVVGSQRFTSSVTAAPLDIYRAARTINPSPYMFLLEFEGFALVGASPETHVRCEDGVVEIRPIAGTRPRGRTPEEDLANERELMRDPKERAEHVMLVDLARNDLGRVCAYGSVHVRDLMVIERYSHVMHIVSEVSGRLADGRTPFDLMRATFPAGTLTGAPKIRAMQIIAEIEGTQRGPYGGCVGYFSFGGNLDCCITIRTALLKDGRVHVQAGGGWVSDSTPEGEFQETINKSQAMIKAVALAEGFRR